MPELASLYPILNYTFKDPGLLDCALTHRSANKVHYERLEFLGDAVLGAVISSELYHRYPDSDEGDLSRLRAHLVKGESLSNIASELSLGDYLRLGSGELKSGGYRRKSILADALEAIIGAIFLDSGFASARSFILKVFQPSLENIVSLDELKDPKTRLQELLQAKGLELPEYTVVKTTGKAHNQTFEVKCKVEGLEQPVYGTGSSRRKAEQEAASQALAKLKA